MKRRNNMEKERIPRPGEIYRHFKDRLYQIIAVAYHSETKEKYVVYQALYGDFKTYIRPYDMFMSEVDHDKYPDVRAKYRFEKVTVSEEPKDSENISGTSVDPVKENVTDYVNECEGANPYLMGFLDKDTSKERIEYLGEIRAHITDRLINDIAAAMDITIDEGDTDVRYESLLNCLTTMARFECNRFR